MYMALPRGARITRNGIEFVNNVDAVLYTLKELIRAALRDSCKLLCNRFRQAYYSHFKRRKGRVGRYTQYWVRSKQDIPDAQVGIKPNGFYGGFEEFGSSKTPRLGLWTSTAQDNIGNIQQLQAQYLSALNEESPSIESEGDYEGGADD